jgi:hypothetical protein
VLDAGDSLDDLDITSEADVAELLAAEGRAVARESLVRAGSGDSAGGAPLMAGLVGLGDADRAGGDVDMAWLAEAVATTYQQGAPGTACRLLTDALSAGIPADPAAHQLVRRLAGPIVGED